MAEPRPGYAERLRIPLDGDETTAFRTASGTVVATGYVRVVIGGRGPYVEFAARHLRPETLRIPDDQRWRGTPRYAKVVYYDEFRSADDANVKFYRQVRTVHYADYRPGMWYASPFDLHVPGVGAAILPLPARGRKDDPPDSPRKDPA